MGGTSVPLEIAGAGLSHIVVEDSHGLHHLLFGLGTAYDLVRGEEVVCHSHQGILGPAAEPIDGAPTNQPRKLECPVAELLTNLHVAHKTWVHIYTIMLLKN